MLYFGGKLSPSTLSYITPTLKSVQKKPVILTWNKFFGSRLAPVMRDSDCLHECIVTENRSNLQVADAVIFHLSDMRSYDLPSIRLPRQYYIFFTLEPPEYIGTVLFEKYKTKSGQHYKIPDDFFNLTITYRTDADVYTPYGNFLRTEESRRKSELVQHSVKTIFERPNLVLHFVSNCNTPSRREKYIEQLKQHINITQLGECFGKRCSKECADRAIGKHKFYLSFENSVCQDYITEKIYLRLGNLLPVVLKRYFEWTKHWKLEKPNYACRLCKFLNEKNGTVKILPDVRKWWYDEKRCEKPLTSLPAAYNHNILKSTFSYFHYYSFFFAAKVIFH
ncbi:unnamed protein product [Enterobius vermicularis]|uniref:Fucosyltransferase n=1 Tax=Enterobius vermicularis TaxID=51028 RepID=A0A0N4VMS7_ENTVE|nr:unnamed protein product [Enterobius vermicularis]